jgi:hypothetical protein
MLQNLKELHDKNNLPILKQYRVSCSVEPSDWTGGATPVELLPL